MVQKYNPRKETILKFKTGNKEYAYTPRNLYRRALRSMEHNARFSRSAANSGFRSTSDDKSEEAHRAIDVASHAAPFMHISPKRAIYRRITNNAVKRSKKAIEKFKLGRAPGMYANEHATRLGILLLEAGLTDC